MSGVQYNTSAENTVDNGICAADVPIGLLAYSGTELPLLAVESSNVAWKKTMPIPRVKENPAILQTGKRIVAHNSRKGPFGCLSGEYVRIVPLILRCPWYAACLITE